MLPLLTAHICRGSRAASSAGLRGCVSACGHAVSRGFERILLARKIQIMVDHHSDQRREADARPPTKLLTRLRRIALQKIDLRRSKIARVDLDVFLPIETDMPEGHLDK